MGIYIQSLGFLYIITFFLFHIKNFSVVNDHPLLEVFVCLNEKGRIYCGWRKQYGNLQLEKQLISNLTPWPHRRLAQPLVELKSPIVSGLAWFPFMRLESTINILISFKPYVCVCVYQFYLSIWKILFLLMFQKKGSCFD